MEIYVVISENEEHEKDMLYVGADKERAYNYKPSSKTTLYLSSWVNGVQESEYYKEALDSNWEWNYGKKITIK